MHMSADKLVWLVIREKSRNIIKLRKWGKLI
jgi:hypothetical protein